MSVIALLRFDDAYCKLLMLIASVYRNHYIQECLAVTVLAMLD
jgi:hypothetical protein